MKLGSILTLCLDAAKASFSEARERAEVADLRDAAALLDGCVARPTIAAVDILRGSFSRAADRLVLDLWLSVDESVKFDEASIAYGDAPYRGGVERRDS